MIPASSHSGDSSTGDRSVGTIPELELRIDAHVCLWQEAPPEARAHPQFPGDDRAYLPRHIAPILQRNRFDGAILVTAGTSEVELAQIAEWAEKPIALAGVIVAWKPNLPLSPSVDRLANTNLLKGIWIDDETLRDAAARTSVYRYCAENGLTLEVDTAASSGALNGLRAMADQDVDAPLVLPHLAGVPADGEGQVAWTETMKQLAQRPQVYVKLSGLQSGPTRQWPLAQLQSLFQFFIQHFTEKRLMFGSDWPYSLPDHAWKTCLARFTQGLGARPQAFREHLLGKTAMRVYQISAAPPQLDAATDEGLSSS